jgi:hypothetical protein
VSSSCIDDMMNARGDQAAAEAHDLLALVYGWFTEGFDTPVLRDAKGLLDPLA